MTNKKIILVMTGFLLHIPSLSFANTIFMETRSGSPVVSSL
jgi:hypothetical protein